MVAASLAESGNAKTAQEDRLLPAVFTPATHPGPRGAVQAVPSRRVGQAGRRHLRTAQGRVNPRAPAQGDRLNRNEMRLPRTGVDHGQHKRGASHRTPPMLFLVTIILCTCAPQIQLAGLDGTRTGATIARAARLSRISRLARSGENVRTNQPRHLPRPR